MASKRAIPKIIHQTWKSKNLPGRFLRFQKTWRHHHPDWEYRLWTDADNRDLIARHYAWFLSIYDSYPEKIMRADAARYFILRHHGGAYADLDCQCLRPIDELLRAHSFVAGREPPQHKKNDPLLKSGLSEVLCNAFLASTPKHSFWDEVIDSLVLYQGESGPLDATGPLMLSRAYEAFPDKDKICLVSHELISPLDNSRKRRPLDAKDYPQAFMIHHWDGTWWRRSYRLRAWKRKLLGALRHIALVVSSKLRFCKRYVISVLFPQRADFYRSHGHVSALSPHQNISFYRYGSHLPCLSLHQGRRLSHVMVDQRNVQDHLMQHTYPLISCLMVTHKRLEMVKRSVHFFMRQTYPNKELLVVCDSVQDDLGVWLNELQRDDIRYFRLPPGEKNLGELRNFSIGQAHGDYVCQWDDDDFYHADRLRCQMMSAVATNSEVCFLHRQLFWLPGSRKLGVCQPGLLENTLLCKKEKAPVYLKLGKQEDTDPCRKLLAECNSVFCDRPDLYVYFYHGGNTWNKRHFMRRWEQCVERYEGVHYNRALIHLSRLYDYDFGYQPPLSDHLPAKDMSAQDRREWPSLLVLVPAKNVAPRLATLVKNLENTIYPKDRLSLAVLESDSHDGTYEKLKSLAPRLQKRCARVELFKEDFGYRNSLYPRWHLHAQRKRRQTLALSRNTLLYRALRDEEWVLWIDADVQSWPAGVIDSLLRCGKDIVVPNCVKPDGSPFDLNTFILKPNADRLDWSRHIYDGLLQPPVGFGRDYLGDHKDKDLVEVDSVGATMLLVRADLHRQGLNFPAFPIHYHIETEGLAEMARRMGHSCWGLPKVEIIHGNY